MILVLLLPHVLSCLISSSPTKSKIVSSLSSKNNKNDENENENKNPSPTTRLLPVADQPTRDGSSSASSSSNDVPTKNNKSINHAPSEIILHETKVEEEVDDDNEAKRSTVKSTIQSKESSSPSPSSNASNWRCACEGGFLPPGMLSSLGGAEAVIRMSTGQCYHKKI